MRIPRIYHPATLTPGMVTELTDDGTNHVARVLRDENRLFPDPV
ncbi:Ribosomal RNA small subunit methyltransferase E [Morganella morganii]|nr:Ribosomal RNA small subunit methyltransferase E [Morganella morganii]